MHLLFFKAAKPFQNLSFFKITLDKIKKNFQDALFANLLLQASYGINDLSFNLF